MSFIPLPHGLMVAFAIVVIMHGLIHLLGFAKGVGLAKVASLAQPISAPVGIAWLLAALAFVASGVLLLMGSPLRWAPALPAVLLSQTLIVLAWKDSRFGTAPNLLVLVALVLTLWRGI